jgi:hypothetical protein
MGWNSWDSFGTTVTEDEVKANADYMAANLASHGWQYIVVDIQWSEPHPQTHGYRPNADLVMDEFGRLTPAPGRFPSAANGQGFKPLADYIHQKGLRFGIHIMRGIPRRAVDANLPIEGSKYHAADIADKQSICRWNGDMYGVDSSRPGGQDYYDSILETPARRKFISTGPILVCRNPASCGTSGPGTTLGRWGTVRRSSFRPTPRHFTN